MSKIKPIVLNCILAVLTALALNRFCSEWNDIQNLACGDLRNQLHPSRMLMAGFDPNLYISPDFEANEFTGSLSPQKLLDAIRKKRITVPNDSHAIKSLNLLLRKNRAFQKLLDSPLPELESFRQPVSYRADDQRRRNRRILEALFPTQCPSLDRKNNLNINPKPTLVGPVVQSATPTFLVLCYPLYQFQYEFVKSAWFLLTWVLSLVSIGLLATCAQWRDGSKLIWIAGLFFIATSYAYHLHVIVGQKYIIYMFLLAAAYYFLEKKNSLLLGGFIIGLLITLRPNVILMLIPFLFCRRWKFVFWVFAGILWGVALSVIAVGPGVWKSYLAQSRPGKAISSTAYKYHNSFFDGAAPDVQRSFLLKRFKGVYGIRQSFVIKAAPLSKFMRSSPFLSKKNAWILPFLAFIFIMLLIKRKSIAQCFQGKLNAKNIPISILFLAGSGLFLLSNCLWRINYSYTDVLWIVPLAIIIVHSGPWSFLLKTAAFPLLIFLFFNSFAINWFPVWGIGLVFGAIIMFIFIPFLIFDFLAKNNPGA